MGRPPKWVAEQDAACGWLPSLREYWQDINRLERQAQAEQRAKRKATDKTRAKCTCPAYPRPHRPGGGLCRYPDPPAECYQRPDDTHRPYSRRYVGLRQQIARNNRLHPIRDRALIAAIMPLVVAQAKQIKRQHPKIKFRNIEIIEASEARAVVQGVDDRRPENVVIKCLRR